LSDLPKTTNVIAHRGGRKWAPENTMEAFKKSLDLGVDGIELDIHRCASGELVVIHDHDLGRTTNGCGLVKDASLEELKRLSAGKWYSEEFEEARIPTLAEVLDLVNGSVILNIEVKNTPIEYPDIEEDLITLLEDYPDPKSIIISSFDHYFMRRFAECVPLAYGLAVLADALLVDLAEYADKFNAKYWHPSFDSLREEAVKEAHRARMKVNAWTLNSPREWADAIKMGIDGVVTDDPEGLKNFICRIKEVAK